MDAARRTFRDPDASLLILTDRVLRAVRRGSAQDFAAMVASPVVVRLMEQGKLVRTSLAVGSFPGEVDSNDVFYEHERIPFVAYPSEWSPSMLAQAGRFTLELAIELLEHGYLLKDASPANVVFNSVDPVLVDLPSIVRAPKGTFVWRAQDQFDRCFMLPLLANLEAGIPIAWSLRDPAKGVSHAQVARILGVRAWCKPSLIRTVAVPAWLSSKVKGSPRLGESTLANDELAKFTLLRTLKRNLQRLSKLERAASRTTSAWQRYTAARSHYAEADIAGKTAYVRGVLEGTKPAAVLDIGANTGEFARLACSAGARVVAIDVDEAVIDAIFASARKERILATAMVANFADPTPAQGWANKETESLLNRLAGRFDLVLMLAVVHHLRVSSGIPVHAIFELAAGMTTDGLVIEHVPIEDPMFQQLSRGRDQLYGDCERSVFEQLLQRRFTIVTTEQLANGRRIYYARKR